ncbi:MAG: hypothetical protein VYC56_02515 [Actinomycetota bacterium]|nr:hypothetical protein [Actinomycetota bacterium]MEC9424314.1 hypothetical protein [Actinomycetota bacterium]MEE2957861.1 hypothetical protein [Actinomycetota bacterium]
MKSLVLASFRRGALALLTVSALTGGLMAFSATSAADDRPATTSYAVSGISDLIWATEHLGYDSPAALQKAGVQVIHFILVELSGVTEDECSLSLGDSIDTSGPYAYTTTWTDEEQVALDWVTDHYCITDAQAQSYGSTILTFFAGLDAGQNGTSAVRRDPPPTTTSTTTAAPTTTTTTVAPTTTAAPTTTTATTTTTAPALYDRFMGILVTGNSYSAALVSGTRDGYSFSALPGAELTISLKSTGDRYGTGTTVDPYVWRNKLDMHLRIYDSTDTLVFESRDFDGTNAYVSDYVCDAPGPKTYTVVATDENALSTWGDYTMTFDLAGKTGEGTDQCLMRG